MRRLRLKSARLRLAHAQSLGPGEAGPRTFAEQATAWERQTALLALLRTEPLRQASWKELLRGLWEGG